MRLALIILILLIPVLVNSTPQFAQVPFRNQDLEQFRELRKILTHSWTIPGLNDQFVPQGIEVVPNTPYLLLSGYVAENYSRHLFFADRRTQVTQKFAVVVLVHKDTGAALRWARLISASGTTLRWHAGGIAVVGSYIYIPTRGALAVFRLSPLLESSEFQVDLILESRVSEITTRGSFASSWGDLVIIGDFQVGRSDINPQAFGLRIDRGQKRFSTILEFDIPLQTQGIAISDQGLLAVSQSYGRHPSLISIYRIPEDIVTRIERIEIASIKASVQDFPLIQHLKAPPGSEGLVWIDQNTLAIVFEGGALPYRNRWSTLEDRVLFLKVSY